MMREISIHDNHKISSNEIQAVNICCPVSSLSHISSFRFNKAYPKPSFPARGLRTYMVFISVTDIAREIKTDNFIFSVHLCQLLRYLLGPIRTSVIDYDNLPIQVSSSKFQYQRKREGNKETHTAL